MIDPLDSFAQAAREPAPSERNGGKLQLDLDIVEDDGDWSRLQPIAPLVDRVARALASHLNRPGAVTATLALSSDRHVRALNLKWRGQDKSTNVLSFPAAPLPAGPGGIPVFLGDIVLASETLFRESAEAGIEPSHHFQHLVVHGLLHLLGYDHESESEADVMERLEVRILGSLGVADPYTEHCGRQNPILKATK
jgi:probable rRNA maturation factor